MLAGTVGWRRGRRLDHKAIRTAHRSLGVHRAAGFARGAAKAAPRARGNWLSLTWQAVYWTFVGGILAAILTAYATWIVACILWQIAGILVRISTWATAKVARKPKAKPVKPVAKPVCASCAKPVCEPVKPPTPPDPWLAKVREHHQQELAKVLATDAAIRALAKAASALGAPRV